MELEVFVHGALCIAYSGRCLLSGYFNRRDPNQGTCTNACRWNYSTQDSAVDPNTGEAIAIKMEEGFNFNAAQEEAEQSFAACGGSARHRPDAPAADLYRRRCARPVPRRKPRLCAPPDPRRRAGRTPRLSGRLSRLPVRHRLGAEQDGVARQPARARTHPEAIAAAAASAAKADSVARAIIACAPGALLPTAGAAWHPAQKPGDKWRSGRDWQCYPAVCGWKLR